MLQATRGKYAIPILKKIECLVQKSDSWILHLLIAIRIPKSDFVLYGVFRIQLLQFLRRDLCSEVFE